MSESKYVGGPVDASVLTSSNGNEPLTLAEDTVQRSLVGSLTYLAAHNRQYLSKVESMLGTYAVKPVHMYMLTAKRRFRYIRGTSKVLLNRHLEEATQLQAHVNSC